MNYTLTFEQFNPQYAVIEEKLFEFSWPCPECNGRLVVKDGCCSSFLGCSNAPHCEATMKFDRICLIAFIHSMLNRMPPDMPEIAYDATENYYRN